MFVRALCAHADRVAEERDAVNSYESTHRGRTFVTGDLELVHNGGTENTEDQSQPRISQRNTGSASNNQTCRLRLVLHVILCSRVKNRRASMD